MLNTVQNIDISSSFLTVLKGSNISSIHLMTDEPHNLLGIKLVEFKYIFV